MVPYYGDFAEDDTVDMIFNAFSSDDPSASVTITNFINTDVHIHKDLGTTQRNNAAGITVSVDFDSVTGNHAVKIDTSDNTVAGFYVTGSEYQVRIEGTTVDGATINAWIGSFSIERAGGVIALLKLIQTAVITNATGADVATDIVALKAETVNILADVTGINGDVMRGTDGANTTVPDAAGVAPTAVEIRTEMDSNSTELAKIGTIPALDAGAQTIGAAIAKIADDSGGAGFDATTDSLEAIRNNQAGGGDATQAKQDQIIAATITNAAGVDIAADIIAAKAVLDGLNDLSAADVNAEVDAALDSEMPAAPTADSLNERIMGLKYNLVNKMVVAEATGATITYKDDDGTEYANVAAAFSSAAGVTTRKRLE